MSTKQIKIYSLTEIKFFESLLHAFSAIIKPTAHLSTFTLLYVLNLQNVIHTLGDRVQINVNLLLMILSLWQIYKVSLERRSSGYS